MHQLRPHASGRLLTGALTLLLVAGCGSAGSPASSGPTSSAAATGSAAPDGSAAASPASSSGSTGGDCPTDFGSAKDSGIEGVPLPGSAVVNESKDPKTMPEGTTTYMIPGSMTPTSPCILIALAAINAWYEQQMPDGLPFGSWHWCHGAPEIPNGSYLHRKLYYTPPPSGVAVPLLQVTTGPDMEEAFVPGGNAEHYWHIGISIAKVPDGGRSCT
jgi:hypothetical protein